MTSKAQKNRGYKLPTLTPDTPTVCVQLVFPDTQETRNAVRSQLDGLGYWWNWEKTYAPGDLGASNTAAEFRKAIHETLLFSVECGDGMTLDFRTSPDDNCGVEYSKDAGETWLPAWTMKRCRPPASYTENVSTQQFYERNAIYIDQQTQIYYQNPDAIRETFDEQPANKRRDIVCYALKGMCESMAQAMIEEGERIQAEQEEIPNAVVNVLFFVAAAASLAAAFVLAPGTAGGSLVIWAAAMGLAGASLEIGLMIWQANPGAFANEEAIKEVRCAVIDNWQYDLPDVNNFRNALSNHALEGDAGDLADFYQETFDQEEFYIAFASLCDEYAAGTEELPDCDCGDEILRRVIYANNSYWTQIAIPDDTAVTFEVNATWRHRFGVDYYDADGSDEFSGNVVLPTAPVGACIYYTDIDSEIKPTGTGTVSVPLGTGRLFFKFNDGSNYSDNRGSGTIIVKDPDNGT